MYALALSHAAGSLADASSLGSALPYVHMGALEIGPLPIQAFGVIVAVGPGVTAAEARLCAWLARGHSLGRASAAAGIKISTSRSQLGSVFRMTGTRRQPELMRLLATLPQS